MKNFLLILLSFSLCFLSCKDDDTDSDVIELRYDDDNDSAPTFPAGTWDAGQRFPSNILKLYVGKQLEEVEFYIQDKPADCEILVFGPGTAQSPGAIIYQKNVSSQVSANSWTTHVLDTPVEIKEEDLWIAVRVVHNGSLNSIGCDAGPANTNGDWILGDGEPNWVNYSDISVSVNWNIRGQVR